MAHAVFRDQVSKLPPAQRSLIGTIDSAGTGAYHIADQPDYRTMETLSRHGINDFEHGARQIERKDFSTFDYVLGMDGMNLNDLRRSQQRTLDKDETAKRAQVSLFGKFGGQVKSGGKTRSRKDRLERGAGDGEEVIDPYYGGDEAFEEVYEQSARFSKALITEILAQRKDDGVIAE